MAEPQLVDPHDPVARARVRPRALLRNDDCARRSPAYPEILRYVPENRA